MIVFIILLSISEILVIPSLFTVMLANNPTMHLIKIGDLYVSTTYQGFKIHTPALERKMKAGLCGVAAWLDTFSCGAKSQMLLCLHRPGSPCDLSWCIFSVDRPGGVWSVFLPLPAPSLWTRARVLCLSPRRRGFDRADSEYTDKLQHYTSGHSE